MIPPQPSSNYEIINRLGAIKPMAGLSSWKSICYLSLAGLCLSLSLAVPGVRAQNTPSPATSESESTTAGQDLEKKAEQLVQWLGLGEYAKVLDAMTPEMRSFWTEEKIRQVWNERVTSTAGSYKRILSSNVVDAVNAKLVIVNTEFQNLKDNVVITFNDQGQIAGVDFPDRRDVQQISRSFIKYLSQKNYALARNLLSPLLKTEIFPQRIKSGWERVEKQMGPLQKILSVDVKPGAEGDNTTLVIAKLKFAKATTDVFLIFDDQKRITNVDYATD
ncbi:MAG: hypothetical protein N5P05_000752 [Chroococcopsis gigantea SAG 12.99]|jgi:hypothetical protein|nr:DUF3887 domain-containing protein [Chlorogloea purpurea SAG 13.99]MDV2999146.1 hypothetical protein [Chroococcopsis gigantea SAG 12.99]